MILTTEDHAHIHLAEWNRYFEIVNNLNNVSHLRTTEREKDISDD